MYSQDFRRLALRVLKQEGSYRRAAAICRVSSSTLHRWANDISQPALIRSKHRRKGLKNSVVAAVHATLEKTPVTTLSRLQHSILSSHGLYLGLRALRRIVKEGVQWTRKRTTHRLHGANHVCPQRVRDFENQFAAHSARGALIVSLDECYFAERTLPLYGYSPRGVKCIVTSPTPTWTQRSLVLAVANNGGQHHSLLHGTVNKVRFREFILGMPFPAGTVIVLDNLAAHKDADAFRDKGYTPLFTPPYSPQFNPVELIFSQVKREFRNAWPWTDGGVDNAVYDALLMAHPTLIKRCFRHVQNLVDQDLRPTQTLGQQPGAPVLRGCPPRRDASPRKS